MCYEVYKCNYNYNGYDLITNCNMDNMVNAVYSNYVQCTLIYQLCYMENMSLFIIRP
jgi:hypothetical protein